MRSLRLYRNVALLNGFGSWTLKQSRRARALEPDECSSMSAGRPTRPDLAIEVVWTAGGIDKLDVYRGLGEGEVWFWREGGYRGQRPGRAAVHH